MNRKCGQTVSAYDRRTFAKVFGADKDKVPHDQTLGNDNKDAMLDCKTSFHQSEDKCNCHFLTSVMIITFIVFLLKQSTLQCISSQVSTKHEKELASYIVHTASKITEL